MDEKIVVKAVGDIWFGDHPVCIGHGVRSVAERKGSDFLFKEVAHLLSQGDITFGNLETVISDKGHEREKLESTEMRGFPECGEALRRARVNLVNVANNHIMQHGLDCYEESLNLLTHNGVSFIGIDIQGRSNIHIVNKGRTSIAFIGYSLQKEEYWTEIVPYSYRSNWKDIAKEVRDLRNNYSGHIVCSLHWGSEFMQHPSPSQIEIGHALIDAGVSVILGHHPHVLQKVEEYGQGIIFYSLGNFLFDLWPPDTRKSIVASLEFVHSLKVGWSVIPIITINDHQPVLADGKQAISIMEMVTDRAAMPGSPMSKISNEGYQRQADLAVRMFRYSSYRYFLKNLPRYSSQMIVQSLKRTLRRKCIGNYKK